MQLPVGLPWIGAHFRMDALSAFFLVLANLGGAGASLFAIGYGAHEQAPGRVLPFYPVFLAAMTLVVLADDAFTFLVAWEFMSLSSWALVMAHHRDPDNRSAGYIYIVMASFGTLTLLWPLACLPAPPAAMRLPTSGPPVRPCRALSWSLSSSVPAPRPALSPCMSGCRSPIRQRPATCQPS